LRWNCTFSSHQLGLTSSPAAEPGNFPIQGYSTAPPPWMPLHVSAASSSSLSGIDSRRSWGVLHAWLLERQGLPLMLLPI
jgi:hypothetical protein